MKTLFYLLAVIIVLTFLVGCVKARETFIENNTYQIIVTNPAAANRLLTYQLTGDTGMPATDIEIWQSSPSWYQDERIGTLSLQELAKFNFKPGYYVVIFWYAGTAERINTIRLQITEASR